MKRYWIEYRVRRAYSPLTYWVHREADDVAWNRTTRHDPPLPPAVPGRGFPEFHIQYGDFEFTFASLEEVRACVDVLGRKILPSTLRLTADRGGGVGPNGHWLSRLPSRVLPWRYREPAVKYMRVALAAFEQELRHAASA